MIINQALSFNLLIEIDDDLLKDISKEDFNKSLQIAKNNAIKEIMRIDLDSGHFMIELKLAK